MYSYMYVYVYSRESKIIHQHTITSLEARQIGKESISIWNQSLFARDRCDFRISSIRTSQKSVADTRAHLVYYKMNYLLLVLLLVIELCGANSFVCQIFDRTANSLEKYCENFQSAVPSNCTREIDAIESFQVEQLKIGGCDHATVLDSIERFKSVRSLDISYSAYQSLDWLDLNVIRLERLNASHNELTNVKIFQQNASDLVELDLSFNQLKRIPMDTFNAVDHLIRLHLSHNAIHHIDGAAFAAAKNLEFLNLDGNRFWSIPVLANNQRLKEMHLEDNPILTFACSDLSTMSETSLYFAWKWTLSFHGDGNCQHKPMQVIHDDRDEGVLITTDGVHEIHCNERSFENLTIFVAGPNSISNGGDLLQCLNPTIMHIDLSGNYIGKLHAASLHRFDRLNFLSLSNTMLMDFDFGMLKSHGLIKLDLSQNDLKLLQNVRLLEVFDSLEELSIGGNKLENVQDLIQHLHPTIKKLDISGSRVGSVNFITFEWLTEMKSLNLSDSMLTIDDFKAFEPLKNLSSLGVSHNNLTNVNFTMLSMLNQLSHFSAAYCHIRNASDVIQHLQPSVQALDLSGNHFESELDVQLFNLLPNLKSLNLSNTNVSSVDFSAFKIPTNLHILDLSNNRLQELRFEPITNRLSHLFLAGNDLIELKNFDQIHFVQLKSLTIAKNQMPCKYLRQLTIQWIELTFYDDPFDQKHGKNCQSTIQSISDFVNSTYNRVKFW